MNGMQVGGVMRGGAAAAGSYNTKITSDGALPLLPSKVTHPVLIGHADDNWHPARLI